MGKVYAEIDERNAAFIQAQQLFFVATAPTNLDAHLNLSPKGLDAFRILDPLTVAYLDLTGSGIETVAHLQENGRIVLMFCAFDGPPRILRLHGRCEVLETSGCRTIPSPAIARNYKIGWPMRGRSSCRSIVRK
jgi:hypothetical protein